MTDKEYELVEKYLRKKYGNDYVDFIDIEGQSYLDGFEEGRISTIEKYSQVDRATISSEETLEIENAELKLRVESLICNLMDIQNKIDEIVTTPKIMQKEENELLCKLIKKICEYTRSN